MATRRYSLDAGESLEQLIEAVGAATVSGAVELTVDLGNTVTDQGVTRPVSKSEVLIALEIFEEYIVRSNWPPA